MSSKRRNRSRWDSPRLHPPSSVAPPPAAAAAAAAAASPLAARNRSPNVGAAAAPPLSDFSLDYRYELSLPAQMLFGRQPWSHPLSDFSNTYSHSHVEPTGLQGHRHGSLFEDSPAQLEEYPLTLHTSKVLQHYPSTFQDEKSHLSNQLVSEMASEASYFLNSERDRWHSMELSRQDSNLYGLSSRPGDVGHALQLARAAELRSERAYNGGAIDAKVIDNQVGSASLIGGREDVLKDTKGRDTTKTLPIGVQDSKLYCSACDRAFPTARQKEAHLQSHVLCEEEHCRFEATARRVKEHMLQEHGKHIKKFVRAHLESQKEVEGTHPNENQINAPENADRKQTSEPREQPRGGLSASIEVDPQDARNDAELVERKSGKNRNYRVPGRYHPY